MIEVAGKGWAPLPGNEGGRIDYPKEAGHDPGTSGGEYFSSAAVSHGIEVAPAANVVLIETFNNYRSEDAPNPAARVKELDAFQSSIINVFLRR